MKNDNKPGVYFGTPESPLSNLAENKIISDGNAHTMKDDIAEAKKHPENFVTPQVAPKENIFSRAWGNISGKTKREQSEAAARAKKEEERLKAEAEKKAAEEKIQAEELAKVKA
ncbi:MAG: hypothetical protein M0P64_04195, partial [Candidatus Pacebacteria bacterium]|nr:hypothetical protein [Candidatus Paceibacterota bacterium]